MTSRDPREGLWMVKLKKIVFKSFYFCKILSYIYHINGRPGWNIRNGEDLKLQSTPIPATYDLIWFDLIPSFSWFRCESNMTLSKWRVTLNYVYISFSGVYYRRKILLWRKDQLFLILQSLLVYLYYPGSKHYSWSCSLCISLISR